MSVFLFTATRKISKKKGVRGETILLRFEDICRWYNQYTHMAYHWLSSFDQHYF